MNSTTSLVSTRSSSSRGWKPPICAQQPCSTHTTKQKRTSLRIPFNTPPSLRTLCLRPFTASKTARPTTPSLVEHEHNLNQRERQLASREKEVESREEAVSKREVSLGCLVREVARGKARAACAAAAAAGKEGEGKGWKGMLRWEGRGRGWKRWEEGRFRY